MAALPVNFGSPSTASGQLVAVSGTVPAGTTFVQAVQLDVLRADTTHHYFSSTAAYTATTTDLTVADTLQLAIVPKLATGETVTLSTYGSLEAQIVEL